VTPIEFFIVGEPRPQPRPRVARGHAYNPPGLVDAWKGAIGWGCKAHRPPHPLVGPMRVDLWFYFPRPKYHFRKDGQLKQEAPIRHIVRPDRDNAEKVILDCLTRAGFWDDDCQVCAGEVNKLYANTEPGVRVVITPLI